MSSLKHKFLHGPSNRSKKQKLIEKWLFGSDSDDTNDETIEEKAQQQQNQAIERVRKELLDLTESESEKSDDDVLDITIDNEIIASPTHEPFVTPAKLQQLISVPPLISPLANTPTHSNFITPSKIQPIARVKPLVSPLAKTPQKVNDLPTPAKTAPRKEIIIISPQAIRKNSIKSIASRAIASAHTKQHKQKIQPYTQIVRKVEQKPNNNCKIESASQVHTSLSQRFGETQTQTHNHLSTESLKQHTSTRTQSQQHAYLRTSNQANTSVQAQVQRIIHNNAQFESYLKRAAHSIDKTHSPLKRARFEEYSNNHTSHATLAPKRSNILKRIGTKTIEEESNVCLVNSNRQICNAATTGPIVERHNFEREIRIKVKNDQRRPTTEVERRIVDSLHEKEKEKSTADGARVIELRNKNVPQGVHLAIAVDKSKFLSKNALRKITRNLVNQM